MIKSATNPGGLPIETFDQLRAGVLTDRSQFFKDLTMPFYGYNRPGCEDFGGRARVVLVARHASRNARGLLLH